jgi:hypothetical protein
METSQSSLDVYRTSNDDDHQWVTRVALSKDTSFNQVQVAKE